MREKVIFRMPDEPEMFLAALAALQGWREEIDQQLAFGWQELAAVAERNDELYAEGKVSLAKHAAMVVELRVARQRHEERNYELTVAGDWDQYGWLQPAFGPEVEFVPAYTPSRGDYDLAFRFDSERAKRVATATRRHAAVAFGLLVGAGTKTIPDLTGVYAHKTPGPLVVVLDYPGSAEFVSQLQDYRPHTLIVWTEEEKLNSLQEAFELICTADIVVGMRSAETYLAAALARRLVELVPETDYRDWLSKWDSPNYAMLYGTEFPAGMVLRSAIGLWDRPLREFAPVVRSVLETRMLLHGMPVATADPYQKMVLPK